jgi:hypothetical protein
MNMRKCLYLCLLVLLSNLAWGQKAQQLVKLKNGSAIRAKKVEYQQDKVQIETADGSIWVFTAEEVERITPAKPLCQQPSKGYISVTKFSVLVGKYKYFGGWWGEEITQTRVYPSINTFNGYIFSPRLAVGIGIGLDGYNSMTLIPLTLGIKGDVLKGNYTPYYGFEIGHAFPWMRRDANAVYSGGLVMSPVVGLKRYGKRGGAFFIEAGSKWQRYREKWHPQPWQPQRRIEMTYRSLSMAIGLQF